MLPFTQEQLIDEVIGPAMSRALLRLYSGIEYFRRLVECVHKPYRSERHRGSPIVGSNFGLTSGDRLNDTLLALTFKKCANLHGLEHVAAFGRKLA